MLHPEGRGLGPIGPPHSRVQHPQLHAVSCKSPTDSQVAAVLMDMSRQLPVSSNSVRVYTYQAKHELQLAAFAFRVYTTHCACLHVCPRWRLAPLTQFGSHVRLVMVAIRCLKQTLNICKVISVLSGLKCDAASLKLQHAYHNCITSCACIFVLTS